MLSRSVHTEAYFFYPLNKAYGWPSAKMAWKRSGPQEGVSVYWRGPKKSSCGKRHLDWSLTDV